MQMASPLTHCGIAITRPSQQAKRLSQLITQAGGTVISFPLIEIAPLTNLSQFQHVIAHIAEYDWAIFISSNAVENSLPHLQTQGIPSTLKFAAIGPTTAQSLQHFGIQNTLIPQGRFDSESLLALPAFQEMQGKKVMIVRGVGGREVLADTLKARGAEVVFAECYQRINPQTDCQLLEDAFRQQQLQAIVVTSSEAMRHLLDLAGHADWLKHTPILVNHARVAAFAKGYKVMVAPTSGDEAMFELLENTLKKPL